MYIYIYKYIYIQVYIHEYIQFRNQLTPASVKWRPLASLRGVIIAGSWYSCPFLFNTSEALPSGFKFSAPQSTGYGIAGASFTGSPISPCLCKAAFSNASGFCDTSNHRELCMCVCVFVCVCVCERVHLCVCV